MAILFIGVSAGTSGWPILWGGVTGLLAGVVIAGPRVCRLERGRVAGLERLPRQLGLTFEREAPEYSASADA